MITIKEPKNIGYDDDYALLKKSIRYHLLFFSNVEHSNHISVLDTNNVNVKTTLEVVVNTLKTGYLIYKL
jgi:hypothetical protein